MNESPNDSELTRRLRSVLDEAESAIKETESPNWTPTPEDAHMENEQIALSLLRAWQLAHEREYQTDEILRLNALTRKMVGDV